MNSITFVLFGKYCPIVDQLGSKDSSRDFQLNCVISYFFTYIYYFMHGSKDWCDGESEKFSTFRVHLNKAPRSSMIHPSPACYQPNWIFSICSYILGHVTKWNANSYSLPNSQRYKAFIMPTNNCFFHPTNIFFRRTNINLSWEFNKKGSGGLLTY
jgi:hypothetical protein